MRSEDNMMIYKRVDLRCILYTASFVGKQNRILKDTEMLRSVFRL
jgi:hypothetical protein